MGSERGRSVKPDLKIGICGEHGGDPQSIAFCNEIGLDYVSCSPFRVPVARLAAAQASLNPTLKKLSARKFRKTVSATKGTKSAHAHLKRPEAATGTHPASAG